MKSKAALEIANTQGRFTFYYNNGQYDEIVSELFASQPEISLRLHDEKILARGADQIRKALSSLMQEDSQDHSAQKYFHMINSPIIKVSERELSAQATWTTLSFILKKELSADGCAKKAEPVVTRFDADYVNENGCWRILNLEWYVFLSLNPWECPTCGVTDWVDRDFKDKFHIPPYLGNTTPEDWWAIIELQNRYAHSCRQNAEEQFSTADDASLYLPMYMDAPAVGHDAIRAVFARLKEMEAANERLYLSILLSTNPVIEVSEDGLHAEGVWFGLNYGIQGPAFGNQEAPYPVRTQFVVLNQKFVKEDGIWKFHTFDMEVLFFAPTWHFDPANTAGLIGHDRVWQYPPAHTDVGTPEDFLEIENIQGQWVYALKSAKNGEVVDKLVAYDDPDIAYHTNDPFMEATTYSMQRVANNVVGAKGIDGFRIKSRELEDIKNAQPHHPSCHTTTTPLIVVHEDGSHATAYWFDFGWTMFAEGFGLPPEQWHANPCFARYAQEYAKDAKGKWKIQKLNYFPLFRLNTMWTFKEENIRGWAGSNTKEPWPLAFERYINEDL